MAQKPLVEGEPTKHIGVRLPESVWDPFNEMCARRGISKSAFLRAIVEASVLEEQEAAA